MERKGIVKCSCGNRYLVTIENNIFRIIKLKKGE